MRAELSVKICLFPEIKKNKTIKSGRTINLLYFLFSEKLITVEKEKEEISEIF